MQKRRPRIIPVRAIKRLACQTFLEVVLKEWPDGIPVTLESLARALELDWPWHHLIGGILKGSDLDRFGKIIGVLNNERCKNLAESSLNYTRIRDWYSRERLRVWRKHYGHTVIKPNSPSKNRKFNTEIKALDAEFNKKLWKEEARFEMACEKLLDGFLKRHGKIIVGLVYKTRSGFVKFQD